MGMEGDNNLHESLIQSEKEMGEVLREWSVLLRKRDEPGYEENEEDKNQYDKFEAEFLEKIEKVRQLRKEFYK